MTVKELKDQLSKYPDLMDVFIAERKSEFSFGLVNSVRQQEIPMKEDPDGEVLGTFDVVILDED